MAISFRSRYSYRPALSGLCVLLFLSVFIIPSLGNEIPELRQLQDGASPDANVTRPSNTSDANPDANVTRPDDTSDADPDANVTRPNVTSNATTSTPNSTGTPDTTSPLNSTGTNGTSPTMTPDNNTTETPEEFTDTGNSSESVLPETGGSMMEANGTGTGMNGTESGGMDETDDMNPSNIFLHNNSDTDGLIEDDSGQTPPPKNQTAPPPLQVPSNDTKPPTGNMHASNALGGNGFQMAVTITLTGYSVAVLGSLFL
jgi:hypothetical protein